MKRKIKLALMGGDLRQLVVARELAKIYEVGVWGAWGTQEIEGVTVCAAPEQAIADADAVILPLPSSTDGITLNCPGDLSCNRIKLAKIVGLMREGMLLVGGKLPEALINVAQSKKIKCFDYFNCETLQIKNAYITAEAALSIAMNSLGKSIADSRFVITGYGRIASQLAALLRKLGASVTVAARKESDRAYAECIGCDSLAIRAANERGKWYDTITRDYDVLFNTVPNWLFDRDFLETLDKKTFIIDLASAPGGVDVCAAKELSANVLWATSLPGKYAHESAGKIISDCVKNILEEELEL